MLKNAGIVQTELTLASAFPPSLSSHRITAPSASMPTPAARTTTPAALDILVDDDEPLQKRSGHKAAIFVGFGLIAAAAVFVVLRSSAGSAPAAAAAPVRGAELPTASAAPVAAPTRVIDLDQEPSPAGTTPSAASPSAGSKPAAKAGKAPKAARPVATGAKRAHGDDELDPGF
jgi:hypothetical protein